MAEQSKIEWCDSTFNPWIGCTAISPACDHCYAEAMMSTRMGRVEWGPGKPRSRTSEANWKLPLRWNARIFWQCDTCGWRGEGPHLDGLLDDNDESVRELCPQCWPEPIAVKLARRRVFCASLADVFDNEVPISWLADLLSLIYSTPSLDWLLLTKRIGNWRARISAVVDLFEHRMVVSGRGDNHGYAMARKWLAGEAPANVWLGSTVVNQPEADRDVPKLLAVPARIRFLSIEPMLGPIRLNMLVTPNDRVIVNALTGQSGEGFETRLPINQRGLDWIICGGEYGPHARPMHPDWPRSLRDQCSNAGVPFFFKQWGEWAQGENVTRRRGTVRTATWWWWWDGEWSYDSEDLSSDDGHIDDEPDLYRVGKRAAGRLLDGQEHNAFPVEVRHA